MKQLSPADGQLIQIESADTPEHIATLTIYDQSTAKDGRVRFKQILRAFESRLEESPIYTNKIVRVPLDLDQPYWSRDPLFDLEYHVRHIALPKPGDWRQLCIQVARLHSMPLDLTRPLWQAYVIEGLNNIEGVPEDAFAVYIKVHHAAVDGMAFAQFYSGVHDLKPVAPTGEYGSEVSQWQPAQKPSTLKLLTRTGLTTPTRIFRRSKEIAGLVPSLVNNRRFARDLGYEPAHSKPLTQFDTPISRNRVFNGTQFPMAEIKKIKAAVPGATINDVAIAIVSLGIRDYLKSKRSLPEKSLVGVIPVSVRNDQPGAQTGNEFNLIAASAHTDIKDPLEVLQKITETTTVAKKYRARAGADPMMRLSSLMPPLMQRYLGDALTFSAKIGGSTVPGNFTVSNVPNSPVPIYLAGAKAIRFQALGVLQHGHGLFHVISSYCDDFMISMLSCREQIPDPQFYMECIDEAFKKLQRATAKSAAPKAKPKTAKRTTARAKASAAKTRAGRHPNTTKKTPASTRR